MTSCPTPLTSEQPRARQRRAAQPFRELVGRAAGAGQSLAWDNTDGNGHEINVYRIFQLLCHLWQSNFEFFLHYRYLPFYESKHFQCEVAKFGNDGKIEQQWNLNTMHVIDIIAWWSV